MSGCESLISTRKQYSEKYQRDIWIHLREPEPCGMGGREYEITRVKSTGLVTAPGGLFAAGDAGLVATTDSPVIRQVLCDRHKRKAEREGMKVSISGAVENTQHVDE